MKGNAIRCTKENAAPDDRASQASSPAPPSAGHATSPSPTAEEAQRTWGTQRTPSTDAQSPLKSPPPRCRFALPGKPIVRSILASIVALLSVLILVLTLIPTPSIQAGGPTYVGGVRYHLDGSRQPVCRDGEYFGFNMEGCVDKPVDR